MAGNRANQQRNDVSSSPSSTSCNQSNIRVVARIRPLAAYETENNSQQVVTALQPSTFLGHDKENDNYVLPSEPEVLQVQPSSTTNTNTSDKHGSSGNKRWFELDAVFDGTSTQEEVYVRSGAKQAVCEDIFKGFNCTILAYGQTGAGKTYSMGSAAGTNPTDGERQDQNDGIIPRAISDLYRTIQSKCDGNAKVELSYMEIYNEEIRDLMQGTGSDGGNSSSSNKKSTKPQELRIRETLNGEVYVSGLTSRPVHSPREIGTCMEAASRRRVTASTKMNAVSSRSHAICSLRIQGVLEDDTTFEAKLTLVDLAGSERIKKTGAQGSRRQEGININKGLFILGQVVSALAEQRPKYKRKPPYRDSKLTRLLQDSLGGNSRTIMLACVSPADFNIEETINTLRYATSARNIKNTATRNVIKSISPEEATKLQRDNQLLAAQVKELQETIQKMANELTPSLASTDSEESDDDDEMDVQDGDKEHQHDEVSHHGSRRIRELENEVKHLKSALKKEGLTSDITQSMAEKAIEVPELRKKIATLEEEVQSKEELEEENVSLREELEEAKADASSSRQAANKLSRIMDQLQQLKSDEIDKKKMEHDHIKVEEAWVSFVFQVLQTNKLQIRQLKEDFCLVARIFESPDVLVPATDGQRWWQRGRLRPASSEGDGPPEMKVDTEMRQVLLSQHIRFFNEKLREVEGDMTMESNSLASIRDSLRQQRDRLDLEIGTTEFQRDSLDKDDNTMLEQLTALLIGPVKNLGDYD